RAGGRLGWDVWLAVDRRTADAAARAQGGPRPPALPEPDAEEHRRRAEAVQAGAGGRTEWRPVVHATAGEVPRGLRLAVEGAGQALPCKRGRRKDRVVAFVVGSWQLVVGSENQQPTANWPTRLSTTNYQLSTTN